MFLPLTERYGVGRASRARRSVTAASSFARSRARLWAGSAYCRELSSVEELCPKV